MNRSRGLIRAFVLAIVTISVMLLASPTQAHDELEQSAPANGGTLTTMPARATLTFAEETAPEDVTVKYGTKVLPDHQYPGRANTVIVDLGPVKPLRTIALTWTAEDEHDGHMSNGIITFHVLDAAAPASSKGAPPSDPRAIEWVAVSARVLGYLALSVFIGGLLFLSLLWPAGAHERRARILLGLSVGAGIASALAAEWVVLWRSDGNLTLSHALTEDYGRISTAMVLLWVLAAVIVVSVHQRGEDVIRQLPWRVGAIVVAVGLIRTTGMNAHATQTSKPVWGIVAEFLHLIGITAWVGGLIMMSVCLLPRRHLAELEHVVPKFSRVALVSVLLIVGSGLILLWQIIGTVDGFWSTHYARILIVKITLFGLVMIAAMKSKSWVEKSLDHVVRNRHHTAVQTFAASVALETLLVVAVLGAASVLVTSSPGV